MFSYCDFSFSFQTRRIHRGLVESCTRVWYFSLWPAWWPLTTEHPTKVSTLFFFYKNRLNNPLIIFPIYSFRSNENTKTYFKYKDLFSKNGNKRNPTILDTLLFRYQSKLYMYCNCKISIWVN